MNCDCLPSYILTPFPQINDTMENSIGSLNYTNIAPCNMHQLQSDQMVTQPTITNSTTASCGCTYPTDTCVTCPDCSICTACTNYCPSLDTQLSSQGVATIPRSECQCTLALNQSVNQPTSNVLNDAPLLASSRVYSTSRRPKFKRKYNAGPGAIETIIDGGINCFQNCDFNNQQQVPLVMFYGRDESYPYKLNKLIHATSCDLCNVRMNSLRSARDHFESKVHDRNITLWLKKEYSDRDLVTPIVKRFLIHSTTTPENLYCDICNLTLTSVIHANQHFAGKKHCLILSKIKKYAANIAYCNQNTCQTEQENRNRNDIESIAVSSNASTPIQNFTERFGQFPRKQVQLINYAMRPDLYCNLCGIGCTSATQMMMHLSGSKHKRNASKKLNIIDDIDVKTSNLAETRQPCGSKNSPNHYLNNNNIDTTFQTNYMKNTMKMDNINSNIMDNMNNNNNRNNYDFNNNNDNSNIITMYRTPSGKYYCKICNKNLTNQQMLQQHLSGKRHNRAEMEYYAKASILYGQSPAPYVQL